MVRYTKRDSKKILKQVARLRGISVSEVREELEIAIEEARNNPDPHMRFRHPGTTYQ